MKIQRALIDIIKTPVREKVVVYRGVFSKMTANPYYTNPYIPVAEAIAAVDALELAIIAADDGSHVAAAIMHDKEVVADNIVRVFVQYVNHVAKGNEAMLLSSGFNISKDVPPLAKPILSLVDGSHSGEVKFITKAAYAVGVYIWQIYIGGVPTLESEWVTVEMTTAASYTMKGLVVGSFIGVRVATVTPDGTSEFCVPVVKVVN